MRRQTCDLIELMEMAQHMAHFYLFMEDDFRCSYKSFSLLAVQLHKLWVHIAPVWPVAQ